MKTFIAALIIFALLCTFVACVSAAVTHRMSELIPIALSLPGTAESFEEDRAGAKQTAQRLSALWARSMEFLPYFMGYDTLDRADEAVLAISAAAEAESCADLLAARLRFIDAAKRINLLFAAGFESFA